VGDLLLSTTLAGQLKNNYPGARVTMLVKKGVEEILDGHPSIDEILVMESASLNSPGNFIYHTACVAKKKFDLAVALWTTASVAWFLYLAGIPARVGQGSRLLYSFLFTHRVTVRSEKGDTKSHWVDCLLDYIRALGCEIRDPEVIIAVDDDTRARVRESLTRGGWNGTDNLWGFHVGKGMALDESRWPVKHFAAIADMLLEELGGALVLTGDRREEKLVAAVLSHMKNNAINMAGRTSLKELAALTSFCSVFICPDSAPGHIAAAMKVPTVGLFALKSDFPDRWKPFSPCSEVVRPEHLRCDRNCSKEKCPRFECYEYIPARKVLEALKRLIKKV
jgi:heptosyltransferase-2